MKTSGLKVTSPYDYSVFLNIINNLSGSLTCRPLRVLCWPVACFSLAGSGWCCLLPIGVAAGGSSGAAFISSLKGTRLGSTSMRWRRFLRSTPPFGVSMMYDRGSGHCSRMVAGSQCPDLWSSTRTSCPGTRRGRSWAVRSWWCFCVSCLCCVWRYTSSRTGVLLQMCVGRLSFIFLP